MIRNKENFLLQFSNKKCQNHLKTIIAAFIMKSLMKMNSKIIIFIP